MDVRITKKNGESFTLEEHDIVVKDFIVSSIPIIPVYEEVEGRNGTVDQGATYGTRTISVPFYIDAFDLQDYPLLRDELSKCRKWHLDKQPVVINIYDNKEAVRAYVNDNNAIDATIRRFD